ncbi:unnamed protein product, partial [Urochloa humidicola]
RWWCCRRLCHRLRLDLAGPLVELPALLVQVAGGAAILFDGDELGLLPLRGLAQVAGAAAVLLHGDEPGLLPLQLHREPAGWIGHLTSGTPSIFFLPKKACAFGALLLEIRQGDRYSGRSTVTSTTDTWERRE